MRWLSTCAGLGVGGEQPGQILDGPLEPVFGAQAQCALHQQHRDAAEGHGGNDGFDRREGQPEVCRAANPGRCQCNKDVDQTLHVRLRASSVLWIRR